MAGKEQPKNTASLPLPPPPPPPGDTSDLSLARLNMNTTSGTQPTTKSFLLKDKFPLLSQIENTKRIPTGMDPAALAQEIARVFEKVAKFSKLTTGTEAIFQDLKEEFEMVLEQTILFFGNHWDAIQRERREVREMVIRFLGNHWDKLQRIPKNIEKCHFETMLDVD